MKIKSVKYRIMWDRLSVFRDVEYEPVHSEAMECSVLCGYTKRVFTLWPPWLWWRVRDLL